MYPSQSPYSTRPQPPPISVPPHHHPQHLNPYTMPSNRRSVPSPQSDAGKDEDFSNRPGPDPISTVYEGKLWSLEVVQEPVRARMCGFGDKDRRPISPPPCVRLVVRDPVTKEEISCADIEFGHFVLTVDLWDIEGRRDQNLLNHHQQTQAISGSRTSGYPITISDTRPPPGMTQQYDFAAAPGYGRHVYDSPGSMQTPSSAHSLYPTGNPSYANSPATYSGYSPYSHLDSRNPLPIINPRGGVNENLPNLPSYMSIQRYSSSRANSNPSPYEVSPEDMTPVNMYARNLIGSSTASAFMLKIPSENHPQGKEGIYFILQDLSVRTEGWFRLKMMFVNLGQPAPATAGGSRNGVPPQILATGSAPVLATVYSKPFKVFSAKKFPGVIESTCLSKEFAKQGIKIPIRKEGGKPKGRKWSEEIGEDDEGSEDEKDKDNDRS